MAGDLDERCADAWDVEPDSDSEAPASPKRRRLAPMPPVAQPRAMEQGTGLAAVRHGVAGVWNFEPIALSLSDVTKCHAKKHISLDGVQDASCVYGVVVLLPLLAARFLIAYLEWMMLMQDEMDTIEIASVGAILSV